MSSLIIAHESLRDARAKIRELQDRVERLENANRILIHLLRQADADVSKLLGGDADG